MQQPTLDLSRLDALKAIGARKKTELQAAQDNVSAYMERSAILRRDIQNLQRQIDRAPGENLSARLSGMKAEQKRLDKKIESLNLDVEIAREHSVAASRLYKRCIEFVPTEQEASE